MSFIHLNEEQTEAKIQYIKDFMTASNAATGSAVDANSNVSNKDVAVLEAELYKDFTIQLNRKMVKDKMLELYGPIEGRDMQRKFDGYLEKHYIYIHDETSLKPYCASVSLYPFLLEGTKSLGGTSTPPTNLRAFCGSFCNLVYQLASNFAGAIATVEFLMYFDHFARKEWGPGYLKEHSKEVAQELQGVIYTMNQPAAARGNQSVFWNISLFDKAYFESLFGDFWFPDEEKPEYESIRDLQTFFLDWFTKERTKALLTFPVVTAAYLVDKDTKEIKDNDFADTLANAMSKGLSFFHYESDSADSLSSCCRLRNELADNTFSYTLGAGGVSTGSFQVITINMNRLLQSQGNINLCTLLRDVSYFLNAYRELVKDYLRAGMLPAYDAGYIHLDKQFGTVGINGLLEGLEWLFLQGHIDIHDHMDFYKEVLGTILKEFKENNIKARKKFGYRFNTEFVPAENLGVKNAKWDKESGLGVNRDCYNSYFFPVENPEWSILDKLDVHGKEVSHYLDGGAACHLNLENIPNKDTCRKIMDVAAKKGVPYWTTNVLTTICKDCGRIDPFTRHACKYCGSNNVEYATRVIGYLKPISSFSEARQHEAGLRYYNK